MPFSTPGEIIKRVLTALRAIIKTLAVLRSLSPHFGKLCSIWRVFLMQGKCTRPPFNIWNDCSALEPKNSGLPKIPQSRVTSVPASCTALSPPQCTTAFSQRSHCQKLCDVVATFRSLTRPKPLPPLPPPGRNNKRFTLPCPGAPLQGVIISNKRVLGSVRSSNARSQDACLSDPS